MTNLCPDYFSKHFKSNYLFLLRTIVELHYKHVKHSQILGKKVFEMCKKSIIIMLSDVLLQINANG